MLRHLIFPILICNIVLADDLSGEAEVIIDEPKDRIPALELLPAGSILKKIHIPRYNKDYTPASLLTADQFEVISDQEIQGSKVCISLYDSEGKIKTQTKLNTVNFNQTTGLITTKENLTFSGDLFTASSQGVTLDWQNHRGFLLGKNQTIIYLKVPTSMTNSPNTLQQPVKNSTKPNSASKLGVVATAAAIASSPTFLSAQELAQIDHLAQPSTALFIEQLDQTKAALAATAEAEAKIATIRKELTAQLGTIPKIDASQPAPPELTPTPGKDFIKITSDRLLFDAKKGIFVYYGNVRITHPKYTFTCDGELKLILSETAAAKKLTPEARAKLKPNDIFDDISQIIATKNVIVRGKDSKGQPVSGITENLSYSKSTGNIILKGKGSRITTTDAQLKVITQNGYLKLDQNMNASGQGAETYGSLPENSKKPQKPKTQ
ncbi:MAG: LptA/OstA family protein [Akkermansiaceae bacterium]